MTPTAPHRITIAPNSIATRASWPGTDRHQLFGGGGGWDNGTCGGMT